MKPLTEFPDAFQPLIVITGDRREVPPQSRGDVLAYSVSSTDYMFINHLMLGESQVVSDKQFVISSEEDLRNRFGASNLLVVGSPAVNLLSRRINEAAAFRFSISEETRSELREQNRFLAEYIEYEEDDLFVYHQCLEGILETGDILRRVMDLAPNLEELTLRADRIVAAFKQTQICRNLQTGARPVRYLMHKLDKPGIWDSLAHVNRGETIGANKDYGLISVLQNPFSDSDEYSIIYVAGVHGPATALGLRLLRKSEAFTNRPFGGVYEVNLERFAPFFDKIQHSKERWETRPYDVDAYERALAGDSKRLVKAFLSSPAGKNDQKQKDFNLNLLELLKSIATEIGVDLSIEGPYTLSMGGGPNFWDKILEYQQDCDFVIHDVTKSSRGVMVEIGFSVGKNRQHFLIWNPEKEEVGEWEDISVPSLLPTSNIDIVDLRKGEEARAVIMNKIVNRALAESLETTCAGCDADTAVEKDDTVFMYTREPQLKKYITEQLTERDIRRASEEDFKSELRLCAICRTLRKARAAFVEISDADKSSYIVLGIAKTIGIPTMPLSLGKRKPTGFAWAQKAVVYEIDVMEERLGKKVASFLA